MRTFKVRKTSVQWNAHPKFLYSIEFDRISYQQAVEDFATALDWCWSTWGNSIDLQSWLHLNKREKSNQYWCWDNQTSVHSNRIYLSSSKEVDVFLLKWK